MLSRRDPGAPEAFVDLAQLLADPAGGTVEVGRAKGCGVNLAGRRLASLRHGVFVLEPCTGAVRYADAGSRHGSLLLRAGGAAPVRMEPLTPVPLWPGDAVAVGGEGATLSADRARVAWVVLALVAPWTPAPQARASPPACASEVPPPPPPPPPECAVCQSALCGARVLACGHAFCCDCITQWFCHNASCPTCRAPCGADAGAPCLALDELALALARDGDRERIEAYRESWSAVKRRRLTC